MSRTKKIAKVPKTAPKNGRRKAAPSEAAAQTAPAKSQAFSIGDRISHPLFGGGTILAIDNPKLSINFDTRGDKQIIDCYVKQQKN